MVCLFVCFQARKVLDLSLSMTHESSTEATVSWKLVRTYAELELFPEKNDAKRMEEISEDRTLLREVFVEGHKRAMYILSNACFPRQFKSLFDAKTLQANPTEVSSIQLVKAKKLYLDMWKDFVEGAKRGHPFPHSAVDPIIVLALWLFCTSGFEDCMRMISSAIDFPWRSDLSREHIALVFQQIQLYHVPRSSFWTLVVTFGPNGDRSRVESISALSFASNPTLLHMKSMSIAKTQLINPLRRFFQDLCFRTNSVIGWLFAMQTELTGANSRQTIKSLIHRALKHRDLSHCPLVWRYCVNYYVSIGDLKTARETFQRAIQIVPYSKCLWLDGSRLQLEPKEWNEVLKLMELKGIRMRFLQSHSDNDD